jgi:carboxylesterase type B
MTISHRPPGGWEIGNSRDVDMFPIVTRSLELDEPVIVVAINYRLTGEGVLSYCLFRLKHLDSVWLFGEQGGQVGRH